MKKLLLMLCMTFLPLPALADNCACGPTYCTGTGKYSALLANKKSHATKEGTPKRLIALYDNIAPCEHCISTLPDGFSELVVDTSGKIIISAWTPENEANDARNLAAGKLKACYVILSRQACGCCNDTPFKKRSDYDTKLDLNLNGATRCKAE